MSNGIYNLMDAFFPAQVGQVGTGATTTSIPTTGKTYIPSAWKGGYMYFVDGAAKGQFASITDNTATTFTVTNLTVAPSAGDVFVLYLGAQVNVSVSAPENIAQVGGASVPVYDIARVPVAGYNQQLPGPSTTTPLGASGSYTSPSFNTAGFSRITGGVFTDQAGNLQVQQSPDGTNWDVISTFSVSANTGQGFEVAVVYPYGRVVYNNGATAQTVFRLYSFLRRFS
jgi:hypothetical protein